MNPVTVHLTRIERITTFKLVVWVRCADYNQLLRKLRTIGTPISSTAQLGTLPVERPSCRIGEDAYSNK